jgi:hypothetical protein
MSVRAKVQNGRLIVDQETRLPEGTVLNLVIDDEGDTLDANERKALDAAISTGLRQADVGDVASVSDILARLRTRRSV